MSFLCIKALEFDELTIQHFIGFLFDENTPSNLISTCGDGSHYQSSASARPTTACCCANKQLLVETTTNEQVVFGAGIPTSSRLYSIHFFILTTIVQIFKRNFYIQHLIFCVKRKEAISAEYANENQIITLKQ